MFDDLDPNMTLLTAFLFLILIWILNSILYNPLLSFMDKRENGIREDEAKIHQNNADANNNETLISKIYADARLKAQTIKNEQILKSKEASKNLIDAKKEKLDSDFADFTNSLNDKKEEFRQELKKELLGCEQLIKATVEKI